jgi:hypothetical protein
VILRDMAQFPVLCFLCFVGVSYILLSGENRDLLPPDLKKLSTSRNRLRELILHPASRTPRIAKKDDPPQRIVLLECSLFPFAGLLLPVARVSAVSTLAVSTIPAMIVAEVVTAVTTEVAVAVVRAGDRLAGRVNRGFDDRGFHHGGFRDDHFRLHGVRSVVDWAVRGVAPITAAAESSIEATTPVSATVVMDAGTTTARTTLASALATLGEGLRIHCEGQSDCEHRDERDFA